MERLVSIVDQLEEAKRFIIAGDLSRLRLALLLLDNASEILMYRAVSHALTHHDWLARLYERARELMPAEELEAFRQRMGYEPLSSKERKALLAFYDAKIDFLERVKNQLPAPIGKVLRATHRYRNEAYHRDRVRKATLRSVVVVLFDIVTDLLLSFQAGGTSYCSLDDWTAFCERYGFGRRNDLPHGGLATIVRALKKDMSLDAPALGTGLADHIRSRIGEMEDALRFVAEHSGAGLSPEEELRRVQYWAQYGLVPQDRDDVDFKNYIAPRSFTDFESWRTIANELRDHRDKLEVFGRFAALEAEFESLEEKIHEVKGFIEQAIEQAIDEARGK